jgi:hypothetical protein
VNGNLICVHQEKETSFSMLTFIMSIGVCGHLNFSCIGKSLNPFSNENKHVCGFISRNSSRPLPEHCLIRYKFYEIQRKNTKFY